MRHEAWVGKEIRSEKYFYILTPRPSLEPESTVYQLATIYYSLLASSWLKEMKVCGIKQIYMNTIPGPLCLLFLSTHENGYESGWRVEIRIIQQIFLSVFYYLFSYIIIRISSTFTFFSLQDIRISYSQVFYIFVFISICNSFYFNSLTFSICILLVSCYLYLTYLRYSYFFRLISFHI